MKRLVCLTMALAILCSCFGLAIGENDLGNQEQVIVELKGSLVDGYPSLAWKKCGDENAYRIYRNNYLIKAIPVLASEEDYSFTDEKPLAGENEYTLYYVTLETGKRKSVKVASVVLKASDNVLTANQTPVPSPTPTPIPTVSPIEGFADEYKAGDKGEEVKKIKLRLQELGYFKAGYDLDNVYNKMTVERVKLFQKENNLEQTGIIDKETLSKLFSDDAKKTNKFATPTPRPTRTPKPTATPYREPQYALEGTGYGDWGTSYGTRWFKMEVKNTSKQKTVDGFTILYCAEDVYGNPIKAHGFGDTEVEEIITMTVKPGGKKWTGKIMAYGFDDAKRIRTEIIRIHFTDGTTVEIPNYERITYVWEY